VTAEAALERAKDGPQRMFWREVRRENRRYIREVRKD
jgi:hypothetical protein